jgi:hypothetical protein
MNFVIAWLDERNSSEWNVYARHFAGDGTPAGPDFKVNDDTGNAAHQNVSVSIDGNGNFVIVWTDKRNGDWDIYAQRYSYDGTALGGNFKVNDDSGANDQFWDDVSLDEQGNFIITWSDQRNETIAFYDIYFQRYSYDGTPIGNNIKVNDNTQNSLQFYPSISIDPGGNFIITWTDERNGDRDIYAQRYLNDGSSAGSNFLVTPGMTGTDQALPSIAADGAGNFIITWNDDRFDMNDIYAQCFSNNGVPVGTDFKVNDDPGNFYQWVPSIAADIDGNFIIAWEDYRNAFNADIYAQSFISGGITAGSNYRVNDDSGSSNQTEPCLATDSSGNFIVAWTDTRNGYQDIYTQRYSSEGIALGNNFKVNEDQEITGHNSPSIAADAAGNFIIVWSDYRSGFLSDIYAQLYSGDGTAIGNNFRVNEDSGSIFHYSPDVASDANGNFIVTWPAFSDSKSDLFHNEILKGIKNLNSNEYTEPAIYARRFSSDGTPLGGNFKVNDDSDYSIHDCPSITIDGSGNFIIAWQDYEFNDSYDIYFQRYNSNGAPIGNNIKVQDSTESINQMSPSISSDEAGNFIITWQDLRNGSFDIYAQKYLNDGTAEGGNFRVNDDDLNVTHSSPSISVNKDGKFIITWTDSRNGGPDIFAQRFLSNGAAYGSNFQVTNTSDGFKLSPVLKITDELIYTAWNDNRGGQTAFDIWANIMDWEDIVNVKENNFSENVMEYSLYDNYPNPFNPVTRIRYQVSSAALVSLKIFDFLGNEIETLVSEEKPAGVYELTWNAVNKPSGVYFYQLSVGTFIQTKKMILLK